MNALKDLVVKYPKLAGLVVVVLAAIAQYYGVPVAAVTTVTCMLAGVGC